MNTTQYSELEKVKLRIKALAAKTVSRGCSEEEALSAMHLVGRLLQQYNLNMNELDVRDATYKTIYLPIGRKRRHPIDGTVVSLARLVDAKTWFNKQRQLSSYAFFGQETDLELVEYLFKVILAAINTEAATFKQSEQYRHCLGSRKTAYVAFQKGMATRISERLNQMKQENDDALATAMSNSRALLVLKGQLTKEAFEKTGVRLSKSYNHSRIGNFAAYHAGQDAGEKVNLSRPITKKPEPKGYLT